MVLAQCGGWYPGPTAIPAAPHTPPVPTIIPPATIPTAPRTWPVPTTHRAIPNAPPPDVRRPTL